MPNDNVALSCGFPLGNNFVFGKRLYHVLLNGLIEGKPICCDEDMGLLAQIICSSVGDHLEIGTAFGGTAIAAVKSMEYCRRPGNVVCIDPYDNHTQGVSAYSDKLEKYFWDNVDKFGVRDRIELVKEVSHPFPINGRRFGSAFIDGDHDKECVKNDWLNIKDIVDKYVMFHDFRKVEVREAVYEWVLPCKEWTISLVCGWSLVMKKN